MLDHRSQNVASHMSFLLWLVSDFLEHCFEKERQVWKGMSISSNVWRGVRAWPGSKSESLLSWDNGLMVQIGTLRPRGLNYITCLRSINVVNNHGTLILGSQHSVHPCLWISTETASICSNQSDHGSPKTQWFRMVMASQLILLSWPLKGIAFFVAVHLL